MRLILATAYFAFCFAATFTSCSVSDSFDAEKESAAIKKVMFDQQDRWNAFDLEGFMKGYWKSDDLQFVGRNGITEGWQQTLKNYQEGYASPDEIGTLTFDILEVEVLTKEDAFVLGKWMVEQSDTTLKGHYTLLWKKIDGAWVITKDHSS